MTRLPPPVRDRTTQAARAPHAGLCERCTHTRRITNARGSVFLRCGRADTDPRYTRYPPLPVLACAGFEADTDSTE